MKLKETNRQRISRLLGDTPLLGTAMKSQARGCLPFGVVCVCWAHRMPDATLRLYLDRSKHESLLPGMTQQLRDVLVHLGYAELTERRSA